MTKKCDIAFFQETHLVAQESQKLCHDWVGFVTALCGSGSSRRVVILLNKWLQFKCVWESAEDAGRIVNVLAEIQGYIVILANAPNRDDPAFMSLFENKVFDMGDLPIIMGGDFNDVINPILDCSSPRHQSSKTHLAL